MLVSVAQKLTDHNTRAETQRRRQKAITVVNLEALVVAEAPHQQVDADEGRSEDAGCETV